MPPPPQRRARAAGLDPAMRLEHFDNQAKITYDRQVLDELFSLRFVADASNALIMGPVGVGKTFIATALGHAAVRRRHSVHFERAGQLFKRLKAARLDNSHDAEIRKLLRADLLILDDFCLQPMDAADTADIYELIVERHRTAATITTSNREPAEWLALMADPLLAQSAPCTKWAICVSDCSPPTRSLRAPIRQLVPRAVNGTLGSESRRTRRRLHL